LVSLGHARIDFPKGCGRVIWHWGVRKQERIHIKVHCAISAVAIAFFAGAASAQEVIPSVEINIPITDETTVSNTIFCNEALRTLTDVNVRVNITHTYDSDLDIILVAPDQVSYVHLCSDVGGASANMTNTVFDQQSPTSILAAVPPMTGSFRPEGGPIAWEGTIPLPPTALANLDSLNGRLPQGFWTLRVDDDAAQDVGVLHNWALILTYAPSTPPSVAATITPAQIAPGEQAIIRAQVTPGTNPPSTGYACVASSSEPSTVSGISEFRDDGVFPDTVASDLNFAATLTIDPNAPLVNVTLYVSVYDERDRSSRTTAGYQVVNGAPGACCINGVCSVMLQSDCQNAGGTFRGSNSVCQDVDQYAITGTSFGFQDISATGSIGPTGDDQVVQLPMGFVVSYFGYLYSEVFISSNGMISFGTGSNEWNNTAIPNPAAPNNAIYALWDDFNPAAGGHVYYQAIDTGGDNPRFIVQWDNVPQFNQNDSNTFQIVIRPNGWVNFNYLTISSFAAGDATVGLENGPGNLADSLSTSFVSSGTSRLALFRPRTCFVPCAWHMDGCFADYTNDGGIDGDDVIAFFADWDTGRTCADTDFSGGTDGDDVIIFFGSWDASGSGSPGC
jgi:subtilisin-like proprotein convertase family protein